MGLVAGRMAGRMQARQTYRTMSRMQRRRSGAQERTGARQDFEPAGEEEPQVPAGPGYATELERLAQLRDEGVITAGDFEAKKKQLLGI